ncbi:hypothetical protein MCHIJ_15890 [Mycolicibacterium chitae]|uniref:Uncharacterized protein n=1 Tax=Mycolicibacterium chitae TaxID=1792 RepID=A0A448HW70_MYCCI|nr:hypothetical protein [Mycolicibacterium chitae]MCV7107288.1 hypothetical protein [Mycolicibacterium chitae]BBZ02152.1 hypothetical protein MCHIJ_15890 [Mycolicibacterium chitae]VEG44163.1 Uncharacterised protein [Mycolicibacterium chitae]
MQITYNAPAIIAAADQVIQNAAGMGDDHLNVHNRTTALLGVFDGGNAISYAEHQTQFMQAFEHLVETVLRFGNTVHTVVGNTQAQDAALAAGL